MGDVFSVYIQQEGGATRTVLFQDYYSDCDPNSIDPVLGGMMPTLDLNNAPYGPRNVTESSTGMGFRDFWVYANKCTKSDVIGTD